MRLMTKRNAVFFISHYGKTIARERAEAERDRLNAEYRKMSTAKWEEEEEEYDEELNDDKKW